MHECDQFMRFSNNPHVNTLYTYWSEPSQSPYVYKSLVLLFDEGVLGDMMKTVVLNPIRPTNRLALKYLCDICKGLLVLHNNNIIHCHVKPSSIYLDETNSAMLGEMAKVELDSARHSN